MEIATLDPETPEQQAVMFITCIGADACDIYSMLYLSYQEVHWRKLAAIQLLLISKQVCNS